MENIQNKLPNSLIKVFKEKKIQDINGNFVNFHSGIEYKEAELLVHVINKIKPKNTLEIGLAMGTSALCFLDAKSKYSKKSIHIAIDPNQYRDYAGVGVKLVKDSGLDDNFKLIEGKTHEIFADILKENIKLDMAFVDGWHTFDYTLIDFFYIDQILKVGGIIAFHDMYGLSKQKVLKYILTHRKYRVMKEYKISEKNKIAVLKFFIWRIIKSPLLIFSKFHWTFQTKSPYGIIFLEKLSDFEPDYNFYKSF